MLLCSIPREAGADSLTCFEDERRGLPGRGLVLGKGSPGAEFPLP